MTEKKSIKKFFKTKAFVGVVLIILICGAFIAYTATGSIRHYSSAKSWMDKKNYERAMTEFEKLGDYKDSKELLIENQYLLGKQILESEDYVQSQDIFQELDTYKDSRSYWLESTYQMGLQKFRSQEYESAIEYFILTKGYEDTERKINEAKYYHAKDLISEKEFDEAIKWLTGISEFADSQKLIAKATYNAGIKQFKQGNLTSAKSYFENVGREYEDTKTYLDEIEQGIKDKEFLMSFAGTWEDEYGWRQVIFSNGKITSVFFPDSHDTKVYTFDVTVENNKVLSGGASYFIKGGKLQEVDDYNGAVKEYSRVSGTTQIPQEKPAPTIGMTASEVRSSNWGSPSDINKTTTAYGVSEQWVYSNFKYIYLEDGIVTSISE